MANDLSRRHDPDDDDRPGPSPDGPDDDSHDDGISGPLESDLQDDAGPVMFCPNCRSEVDLEADRCDVCGHYLTEEGQLHWQPQRPWWATLTAALILLMVFAGLVMMIATAMRR